MIQALLYDYYDEKDIATVNFIEKPAANELIEVGEHGLYRILNIRHVFNSENNETELVVIVNNMYNDEF